MSARKVGVNLIVLGILALIASVLWWALFYRQVAEALRASFPPPVECLYQSGGPCGFVSGVANAMGTFAYTPLALYLSLGTLAVGVIVLMSSDVEAPPPAKPAPTERREPSFGAPDSQTRDRF